jgi:hypothetical protein
MPRLPSLHLLFILYCVFSFDFCCSPLQIFAKPFVGAMDGHIDAVSSMAKNSNYLKAMFSGSMDGGNCHKSAPALLLLSLGLCLIQFYFLLQ